MNIFCPNNLIEMAQFWCLKFSIRANLRKFSLKTYQLIPQHFQGKMYNVKNEPNWVWSKLSFCLLEVGNMRVEFLTFVAMET